MKHIKKGPRIEKCTPPKYGLVRSLSNPTPLSRSVGKMVFDCPVCGVVFERSASSARRYNNHYCGRGCSAEAQKVRVETHCVVCGKSIELIPSLIGQIKTCSKTCSSIRRRSENTRPGGFAVYQEAAKKTASVGACSQCGVTHGPWVVRGLKIMIGDDKTASVDDSNASLWCRACHLKDLAPIGGEANKIRILSKQPTKTQ